MSDDRADYHRRWRRRRLDQRRHDRAVARARARTGSMLPVNEDRVQSAIAQGVAAAGEARALRRKLRWRSTPGDPQRAQQIERALEALRLAMEPVRSEIGRLAWEPLPDDVEAELRATSAAVQYERRQLKKMRR